MPKKPTEDFKLLAGDKVVWGKPKGEPKLPPRPSEELAAEKVRQWKERFQEMTKEQREDLRRLLEEFDET